MYRSDNKKGAGSYIKVQLLSIDCFHFFFVPLGTSKYPFCAPTLTVYFFFGKNDYGNFGLQYANKKFNCYENHDILLNDCADLGYKFGSIKRKLKKLTCIFVFTPALVHSHTSRPHSQIYSHPPAPELAAGVDEAAAPPSAAAGVASEEGAGVAKASDVG